MSWLGPTQKPLQKKEERMKRALFLLVLVIAWFPLQAGAIEIEESDSVVGPADFNKVMASLGINPTQNFMSWYGPIPNVALKETWVYQNKLQKRTVNLTETEAMVTYEKDPMTQLYGIWVGVWGYYEDTVFDIETMSGSCLLTETVRSFSLSDSVFQGDVWIADDPIYLVNVELKGAINKKTGELSVNGKFKGGVYTYMFSGTLRFKLPLTNMEAASTPSGSKVFEKIEKIRNMRRLKQQGVE
jgi:hypothetical protein